MGGLVETSLMESRRSKNARACGSKWTTLPLVAIVVVVLVIVWRYKPLDWLLWNRVSGVVVVGGVGVI